MDVLIKNKLMEIMGLCYEISEMTYADVLVRYNPHVNNITVLVYEDGLLDTDKPYYLAYNEKISIELLDKIIIKLNDLYEIKKEEVE